jgi:hypothetical protein
VNHRTLLIPFAALFLAACKPEPEVPAGVISRDRFVAANVAVRTLPDTVPQARRDSALKKVGVTDRQLRAWVTAYSRQPETLSKAWEEIAFKVDSIGGTQPIPGGGPPPQAGPPPPAGVGTPLPVPPPSMRDDSGRVIPRRQRPLVAPPEELRRRGAPAAAQ